MHHCKIMHNIAKICSVSDSWKWAAVLLDPDKAEVQQNFKIHDFCWSHSENINYLLFLEQDKSLPCSNTVPLVWSVYQFSACLKCCCMNRYPLIILIGQQIRFGADLLWKAAMYKDTWAKEGQVAAQGLVAAEQPGSAAREQQVSCQGVFQIVQGSHSLTWGCNICRPPDLYQQPVTFT